MPEFEPPIADTTGEPCKRCEQFGKPCRPAHEDGYNAEGRRFEEIEGRCNARKTDGSGLCRQGAGWGTSHPGTGRCKWHGGSTPSQEKRAQRDQIRKEAERLRLRRDIDDAEPEEVLLEEVARAAGICDWLERLVLELDDDEVAFGVTRVKQSRGGDAQVTREAAESVLMKMYREERKHLLRVCDTALSLGIAERHVRLAERQGKLFAEIIQSILDDIGMGEDPDARRAVRRRLTVLQGGKASA